MLFTLLFACSGAKDSAKETEPAPTMTWLTPLATDSVTAGSVACSLVIEHFTLTDPAKHSEGLPEGYISVSVDGTEVTKTGSTNFTLDLTAGAHTLEAALFYSDGDEVAATSDRLCEEDDADTACAPVSASVEITVQ